MRSTSYHLVKHTLAVSFALFALLAHASGTSSLLKQSCISEDCSAVRITIDNPPFNLFDINLISEFDKYLSSLNNQTKIKVVVFSSDVPGFFAGHLDLNFLSNTIRPGINASEYVDKYLFNIERLLDLPVVFIGEINGRTWEAGNENAVRYDMRFAGPDAVFGAPEAAAGLIHVGGAQQLVQLVGPALATEYLLASTEVNATEAARTGWVNSAHPTAGDLRKHVENVARRIANTHIEVIRAHKASIREQSPSKAAMRRDLERFVDLSIQPYVQVNVAKILRDSQNESRTFELDVNENIVKILQG